MANAVFTEQKFSRVWLVLAVVLVMFFIAFFVDRIVATLVPTYTGIQGVLQGPPGQLESLEVQ